MQLRNATGPLAGRRLARVYLSSDVTGTPSLVALAPVVAVGSLLAARPPGGENLDFDILSDAAGVVMLLFDNSGGGSTYTDRVALVLPDGSLVVSAPLAVAPAP